MSNYIVITYDDKDTSFKEPKHIEKMHYREKEEVMSYITDLPKGTKYEVYKEIYLEVTEEYS